MDLKTLTYIVVGASFLLYIGIAIWAKARSTNDFYVAGGGVHPVANGMATAADWMSAASFISMAGLIAFLGYGGSVYLMGWTGGYVLLALLLAPYLRKFGKFTVPEFIGERYYSQTARLVAVVCLIFISFTYVAGQMRGVGIVFSRFLEVDIITGLLIGMGVVFFYAVLGGMKGITYTQVAQYCVLIFAYTVPAVFIAIEVTGVALPQIALGSEVVDGSGYLLDKLDKVVTDLGFTAYTQGTKSTIDMFAITVALMVGTAGLPHVIVRFFTVPKVRDARKSAGWALLFITLLYTTAPAVGALARLNLIDTVNGADGQGTAYTSMPSWFQTWENSGLIAWYDHNGDGKVQYAAGKPMEGKPKFEGETRGTHGERVVTNPSKGEAVNGAPFANELHVDRDIMVLANPEIANLPMWVIALIAAGGIAAALSTAAGLLLVISASISHDIVKGMLRPNISERNELMVGRISAAFAILIAGYLGANPPAFVAQVVAFAFGLAASSLFPVILMGIFNKRMNREGAISGMLVGLVFTIGYILYFKGVFITPMAANIPENWLFGISPEGIGFIGMLLNFLVAFVVSKVTSAPPEHIQHLVEDIRVPKAS
ncbi:sodium:solute symporter family protein [Candidatus Venteria ishoeyi]|uniref:Cation/acetate symporter ActP n=1 Tax=Candidatus Venteria ishoeyi TaxID=1899563 RepID=A0A1H6FA15_9GAMM|nr:sodium:solute symporter family protein [Candidatus Venteria ishoeyi]MDM8546347.1 sodium:solute symporter family protein [Candidatus Venteria ishoeyi]SEH06928.1 Cation/acetate symporter ActP [Candidatus Venteria ishoeyi]